MTQLQNEKIPRYPEVLPAFPALREEHHWLVTGAAGFIGSHLVEALLSLGQRVTALDDLSAGYQRNVKMALAGAGAGAKNRLEFIEGSITNPRLCLEAACGVEFVLHHAAMASVPASIEEPLAFSQANAEGFVNVLEAARASGARRMVYASSSAVYGDGGSLPKVEAEAGQCLSPYALTKTVNELYANLWTRLYGLDCVGLRYFNVFGPRQDPGGAYAAVIPRWIDAVRGGREPILYGDGTATRDFCSVRNVVLANLLSALTDSPEAPGQVFNIACGISTSLRDLLSLIAGIFAPGREIRPVLKPSRAGDIHLSVASIERAERVLDYHPIVSLEAGLQELAAEPPTQID